MSAAHEIFAARSPGNFSIASECRQPKITTGAQELPGTQKVQSRWQEGSCGEIQTSYCAFGPTLAAM